MPPKQGPRPLTQYQASAAWPKVHYNNLNTCVGLGGGSNGVQRWAYTPPNTGEDPAVHSSAAIGSDGTVYFGANNDIFYALNPDGTVKWSFTTGAEVKSSPAIGSDGTIYFGSQDDNFYALNPNGTKKWSFPTGGGVESSPAIATDGTIYFGSDDNNVYALNPNGTQKWVFPTGNEVQSSPAIAPDGTIYIGSADQNLYAITPSGTQKWSFSALSLGVDAQIYRDPMVGPDGTVYFTTWAGFLVALNSDGTTKWTFNTWFADQCTPALGADGTIYVGASPGLYAVNPDGTQKWLFTDGGDGGVIEGESVGSDGTIYVALYNDALLTDSLIALNPDGSEQWSLRLSTPSLIGPVLSTPAIGKDGAVYVGVVGTMYAIGTQVDTDPVSTLTLNPSSVKGGVGSTATITLSQAAPSGGAEVHLSSSDPTVSVPAFVAVPSGQTSATFPVTTVASANNLTATISATSGGATATATLTVTNVTIGVTALTLNPTSVSGGNDSTGTVTLSGPAPSGGLQVDLSSNSTVASVPTTMTVASGATTGTFTVTTTGVASKSTATITAGSGSVTQSATLTVTPSTLQSVTLNPTSVAGSNSSAGLVTLSGVAGPGGAVVSLASNISQATVPASVSIAAGARTGPFVVKTTAVSKQVVATISGTFSGVTQKATLTITLPAVSALTLNPPVVVCGSPSTGTIRLDAEALSGGLVVKLTSSDKSAVVPNSVTVPAGKVLATFPITTKSVTSEAFAKISASGGGQTASYTLDVLPIGPTSVTFNPASVAGGVPSTGTVTLNGPAPSGGTVVRLFSNEPYAVVPVSVTVAAGKSSVSFGVKTSPASSPFQATITATVGSVFQTGVLGVGPLQLISITLKDNPIPGGATTTGTCTFSAPVQRDTVIPFLEQDPAEIFSPFNLVIPKGKSVVNFQFKTAPTATLVSDFIFTQLGPGSVTAMILPPSLVSYRLDPATVKGGQSTTLRMLISSPSPASGLLFSLLAPDNEVASAFSNAAFPGGVTEYDLPIQTSHVSQTTIINYTLDYNLTGSTNAVRTFNLTITP